VANRLPPALYRKLVIGGAATLVGGTIVIAASSGIFEQMGRAAGVRLAAITMDGPTPPDTARPALGVMVVTSVGGMRPRLVLDVRNDGDTTIQQLYALVNFRSGARSVASSAVAVADEKLGPLPRGATRRVLLRSNERLSELPWYGGPFVTADVYVARDQAGLGRPTAGLLTGFEVGQE
jgi:hypothetical protein